MKRVIGVFGCLFLVLALTASAAWADVNFSVVGDLEAKIKASEAQKCWKEVEAFANRLADYLQENGGHKYDDQILSAYAKVENAQIRQGQYNQAANTVREVHAWKASPTDVDKTMKFERMDLDQRDYYNKTLEFYNKRVAIKKELLEMAKQKEELVKTVLQQKSVKKEDLEKLQAALKAVNEKMAAKNTELKDTFAKFEKDVEGFKKSELIFRPAMEQVLAEKARQAAEIAEKVTTAETAAQKNLVAVTEKFKYSWAGLEEKLTKMKDVQLKVMDLQNKMLGLMEKKPLTDADKKALNDLKAEMDKLMSEHDKLLSEIESAFMDAKVFNKLSGDEQKRYMDIFQVLRDAQKVITLTNAKINEFLKKMNFKFGDLNGDGKVDAADYQKMWRNFLAIGALRWPPMYRPAPYNKAADLDGDGKITWADMGLLREAVWGSRKTFPADPENVPGDMDGDGRIDNDDINMIARMMFNPKLYVGTSFIKIADLNKDGKIDVNDLIEAVKRMTAPVPVAAPAGAVKPGTVDTTTGAAGTGEATGKTDSTTPGQTGTSADSINKAY